MEEAQQQAKKAKLMPATTASAATVVLPTTSSLHSNAQSTTPFTMNSASLPSHTSSTSAQYRPQAPTAPTAPTSQSFVSQPTWAQPPPTQTSSTPSPKASKQASTPATAQVLTPPIRQASLPSSSAHTANPRTQTVPVGKDRAHPSTSTTGASQLSTATIPAPSMQTTTATPSSRRSSAKFRPSTQTPVSQHSQRSQEPGDGPENAVAKPLTQGRASPVTGTSRPPSAKATSIKGSVTASPKKKKRSSSKPASPAVQPVARPRPPAEKWPPEDDYRLIANMLQTADAVTVHQCVKFSQPYMLSEIKQRWHMLLLQQEKSRLACAALAGLSSSAKAKASRSLLWSDQEENVLLKYAQRTRDANPPDTAFRDLLFTRCNIFHESRTPADLKRHYHLMLAAGLLAPHIAAPQETALVQRVDEVYSDVVAAVETGQAKGQLPSPAVAAELANMDRREKSKIRTLETQLDLWRSSMKASAPSSADRNLSLGPTTLAVIFGPDNYAYHMQYKEIIVGRQSSRWDVDINLSIFPRATSVSRWHCTIKLKHDSYFYCHNKGKKPVTVNGVEIATGAKRQMGYDSLLEICGVTLRFMANLPVLHHLFGT